MAQSLFTRFFAYLSYPVIEYTKSAQPGLAVGNIEKLFISVPSLEEQERIVAILDRFDALTTDISNGLPDEIATRQKQYEYYLDKLLIFKEIA